MRKLKLLENIETIKKGTKLITTPLFGGLTDRVTACESVRLDYPYYLKCDVEGSDQGMYTSLKSIPLPVDCIIAIVEGS